jgi:putative PIN family toxin of toxin-antitoxin system
MRVVLDSNVLVAAYATHGLCHSLLEICLTGHTLLMSPDILDEVSDKLEHKIKVPSKTVKEILLFLKKNSVSENPVKLPSDLCRDPDDLNILGLAVAGNVDCLVSGDKDLLVLKQVQGIPILTPREFYKRLQNKT